MKIIITPSNMKITVPFKIVRPIAFQSAPLSVALILTMTSQIRVSIDHYNEFQPKSSENMSVLPRASMIQATTRLTSHSLWSK